MGFSGHLAWRSKGLGRDPAAFGEAVPYLASSVSGVQAASGLWAGNVEYRQGLVWGEKSPAACAEGCARAGVGLSPLPVLHRQQSGVLEQN